MEKIRNINHLKLSLMKKLILQNSLNLIINKKLDIELKEYVHIMDILEVMVIMSLFVEILKLIHGMNLMIQ